jgi:peptide subunit release factor 1 (eRF1)
VHKTGTGGWAAKRFEASVEESWERSARQVAELVANLAHALGTTIIIASGEPKTLSMLAHELPGDLSETFTTVPGGGRHKDGGEAAVADRVAAAVAAGVARDELAVLERFAAARGRGEGAVEGAADVVEALQQAQVGTLIIASAHADSSELAWFGPEPTQFALKESDLAAMGVSEVHQGALVDVLLRAAAGSGAAVLTVSDGVDNAPREGIGGLLRFDPNAQVNSVA